MMREYFHYKSDGPQNSEAIARGVYISKFNIPDYREDCVGKQVGIGHLAVMLKPNSRDATYGVEIRIAPAGDHSVPEQQELDTVYMKAVQNTFPKAEKLIRSEHPASGIIEIPGEAFDKSISPKERLIGVTDCLIKAGLASKILSDILSKSWPLIHGNLKDGRHV